jgi:hypothetical protein
MTTDLCKTRAMLQCRLDFLIKQETRLKNTRPVVRLADNRTEQMQVKRKLRAIDKALGDNKCEAQPSRG